MYEETFPNKRFKLTLEFLKKHCNTSQTILDLGVENIYYLLEPMNKLQLPYID